MLNATMDMKCSVADTLTLKELIIATVRRSANKRRTGFLPSEAHEGVHSSNCEGHPLLDPNLLNARFAAVENQLVQHCPTNEHFSSHLALKDAVGTSAEA